HPAFWPDPFYDVPRVVDIDPVQVSYSIQCFKDRKVAPLQAASDAFIVDTTELSLAQVVEVIEKHIRNSGKI
ncbi:MAG: (d)CMP kinase, partial [Pseudobdellovibrio sp.]